MNLLKKIWENGVKALFKYYLTIICTAAVTGSAAILLMFAVVLFSDIDSNSSLTDIIFVPLFLGVCAVVFFPVIILGLIGDYLVLFKKWKGSGNKQCAEVQGLRFPHPVVAVVLFVVIFTICLTGFIMTLIGVFFFNVVTMVIMIFGLIIFIPSFLLLVAHPPIFWIELLKRGRHYVLRDQLVLRAFAWGMLSPIPVLLVVFLLDGVFYVGTGAVVPEWAGTAVVAPVVEEFFKALGLVFFIKLIRNRYDGLILGFACGIGFAMVENLGYFSVTSLELSSFIGTLISWIFVVVLRSIKSCMSHGLGSALIGFTLGFILEKKKPSFRPWYLVFPAYLGSVALHAAWNGSIVLSLMLSQTHQDSIPVNIGLFAGMAVFFLIEFGLLVILRRKSIEHEPKFDT